MIFSEEKSIILIILVYSCQCLVYVPRNITRMDLMLERMDRILSGCRSSKMNYIGLIRDAKVPASWSSKFMRDMPTIRLEVPISPVNEPFYPQSIYRNNPFRYDKLHMFVLFVSSPANLNRLIEKLATSVWWNPRAFYAIVDTNIRICKRPQAYLSIAWNMDLKSTTFFCIDSDKGYTLYTYNYHGNPVSSRFWHVSESAISEETRTWSLLRYKLRSATTCEDINLYKKTKVGGYKIKLVGMPAPPTLTFHLGRKGMEKYGGMDILILKILFDKINATMSMTMLNKNTELHSLLRNVSAKGYDMLMNAQYIFNNANSTITYPHMYSGISSLTRHSGFDSNETKILQFMNPLLIIGILVISVITLFVLGLLAGLDLSTAFLEVVRITVNSSIMRFPRTVPLRIYLITVLFLHLITGSIFQSSLSTILTSSVPKPNVDSNEALKRSGYQIYTFADYKEAIDDHVLRTRARKTGNWDCSRYVIERANTACVADRSNLMKIAFENNLHISRRRVTNMYVAYVTRPNFPLVGRIGIMLMSMSQCGLLDHWKKDTIEIYQSKWTMMEQERKRSKYRQMKINDLLFVFYVLFLGFGLALVTFLSELSITYWRSLRTGKERRT